MLLTDRVRSVGAILANSSNGKERARFTVGHELGHFLLERHILSGEYGFECSSEDLAEQSRASNHRRQEAEANRFAIELLAPAICFKPAISQPPDLNVVLELSDALQLSKEATARRYLELCNQDAAIVFYNDGVLRYFHSTDGFPRLLPTRGTKIVLPSSLEPDMPLSSVARADPKDWFDGPPMAELFVQRLMQRSGHGMVLLYLARG